MMSQKLVPPYIYCVRCGSRVDIVEDSGSEAKKVMESQGFSAIGKGICECGAVYVLCVQRDKSPTFSLFFDIYRPTDELLAIRRELYKFVKQER